MPPRKMHFLQLNIEHWACIIYLRYINPFHFDYRINWLDERRERGRARKNADKNKSKCILLRWKCGHSLNAKYIANFFFAAALLKCSWRVNDTYCNKTDAVIETIGQRQQKNVFRFKAETGSRVCGEILIRFIIHRLQCVHKNCIFQDRWQQFLN